MGKLILRDEETLNSDDSFEITPDGTERRTIQILARRQLDKASNIRDPRSYEASIKKGMMNDGTIDEIRSMRADDPMLTPVEIADALSLHIEKPKPKRSDEQIVAAQAAGIERHENPCPECFGAGMIEQENGFADFCTACR